LPNQATYLTVIKDADNPYFASFVVESFAQHLPKTENSIGIDLGISTWATVGRLLCNLRKYGRQISVKN